MLTLLCLRYKNISTDNHFCTTLIHINLNHQSPIIKGANMPSHNLKTFIKISLYTILIFILSACTAAEINTSIETQPQTTNSQTTYILPPYTTDGTIPDQPITRGGLRTTPSAGALYPLEIYVIVGNVDGLEPGVFRYISEGHKLIRVLV